MSRSEKTNDLRIIHNADPYVYDTKCCKGVAKEQINFWRHKIEETNFEIPKSNSRTRNTPKADDIRTIANPTDCQQISKCFSDVSSSEKHNSEHSKSSKSVKYVAQSSVIDLSGSWKSLHGEERGSTNGTERDKNRHKPPLGPFVQPKVLLFEGTKDYSLIESQKFEKNDGRGVVNSQTAECASDTVQNIPETFIKNGNAEIYSPGYGEEYEEEELYFSETNVALQPHPKLEEGYGRQDAVARASKICLEEASTDRSAVSDEEGKALTEHLLQATVNQKFWKNPHQLDRISREDPPLVQNQKNNIGYFAHDPVSKLCLQLKTENSCGKNASKATNYVPDNVERAEKAVQTDWDLPASEERNDQAEVTDLVAHTAIGNALESMSPPVILINKVEHFSQQTLTEEICETVGTKLEMIQNPIFQTDTIKQVIETLKTSAKAGVRGDACSGKTSVLYGVMQIFGEINIDWNVIFIKNEEHISACHDKRNVLLVIDDILDRNNYMLRHLDTLEYFIVAGFWKIMFSYSNESHKEYASKLIGDNILDGNHVFNISMTYKSTVDEKTEILISHCKGMGYNLPEETSKQCVESVPEKYFFYYVRSYVNTYKCRGEFAPLDFFQNPIIEMVQDLLHLKESNYLGFYCLFRYSVLGCDLDSSTPFQSKLSEHAMEISKWLLNSNDNPHQKSFLKRMQSAIENVPTDVIENIGDCQYRIRFVCVVRAVQFIILKKLNIANADNDKKRIKHALLLCDFSILRNFLRCDDCVFNPLQLKIQEENFRHVAVRFIVDIQSGHVRRVGRHPLFSNDDFKRIFISQLRRRHEKEMWDIFSKLDNQIGKALIVFVVKHDKPDHVTHLTNFILQSKKWKKYSRKEGENEERHLLVLQQNASALRNAVRYKDKSINTCRALIDSVFINIPKLSKWSSCLREEAIRCVVEIHAMTLSDSSETTTNVLELFHHIDIATHINKNKQTLLHVCVICRNEHILERALHHRKDEINCQDHLGRTPLHTAVESNNLEAIRILIEYGALIEIKDINGDSAIHLALNKSTKILEELICVNGTDVNVRNKDGKTPHQLACELHKRKHKKSLEKADVQYE